MTTHQYIAGVIDGNSLFARAFFATKDKKIFDEEGRSAGGVTAGLRSVLSFLDLKSEKLSEQADRLLFCWDSGSKSQKVRATKPPEYYEEMERFQEVLSVLLGAAHARPPGCEADDVVATVALRLTEAKVYVVSGDKDLQQLAGGHISYFCLNEGSVLSPKWVSHKWSVKRPSQIAIVLAILGDRSDGVPGIKGWGKKKVQSLFEAVTDQMSFEEALKAVDDQVPEEFKEIFYHSLDLTLLDPGIEGVPDPAPLRIADPEVLMDRGLPASLMAPYQAVFEQYTGRCLAEEMI